jgi:hypothetical protein
VFVVAGPGLAIFPSIIPTISEKESLQMTTGPSASSISRVCPVSPVTTVIGSVSI